MGTFCFPELLHVYFSNKILREAKEQKTINRNCPRGSPDDRLTRYDFKSPIINMFKNFEKPYLKN